MTRSQTQKEMDELIIHVSEKIYAYGVIRAENQNLLSTISELKTRLEKVEKGKSVVQIVLWVVDSGCSKHMTGDRSLLRNFIEKFMGTVRFGNDNFAAITGYGDYIHGNITICHVYYVEGLGHNLFSVGQFCDGDLEVAFRSNTCYVRNLEGDDLLTGGRESNLYTISISDMAASSPVYLTWLTVYQSSNMERITFVLLVKGEKARKAYHQPKLGSKVDLPNWNDLYGFMRSMRRSFDQWERKLFL
ncbi:hypothetical protein Tco_0267124 [Tanacetum coccineum]